MNFLKKTEENGLPKLVTIQNPYNLLNRTYEVGLAEISMREHIGLLAYSPMAFGLLSGKYHNHSDVSNSRIKLFPKFARYSSERVHYIAGKYINVAKKYGLSPGKMALAYVSSRPFLSASIIGVTNMDQLKENVNSINISLPEEVIKEIELIHTEYSNPAP